MQNAKNLNEICDLLASGEKTKILHMFLTSPEPITNENRALVISLIQENQDTFDIPALEKNIGNFIALSMKKQEFEIVKSLMSLAIFNNLIKQDLLIDVLSEAIRNGSIDICTICLKMGEFLHISPVNEAIPALGSISPLILATSLGQVEIVKSLLMGKGILIDQIFEYEGLNCAALQVAIMMSRDQDDNKAQKFSHIIDILLTNGADVHQKVTVLHQKANLKFATGKVDNMQLAIAFQKLDIINILLKHGFQQGDNDNRFVLLELQILKDFTINKDHAKIEKSKKIIQTLIKSGVILFDAIEEYDALHNGYPDLAFDILASRREFLDQDKDLEVLIINSLIQKIPLLKPKDKIVESYREFLKLNIKMHSLEQIKEWGLSYEQSKLLFEFLPAHDQTDEVLSKLFLSTNYFNSCADPFKEVVEALNILDEKLIYQTSSSVSKIHKEILRQYVSDYVQKASLDFFNRKTEEGNNLLQLSIICNNYKLMTIILDRVKDLVSSQDNDGNNAIHYACMSEVPTFYLQRLMSMIIIESGYTEESQRKILNQQNVRGDSPLHLAISSSANPQMQLEKVQSLFATKYIPKNLTSLEVGKVQARIHKFFNINLENSQEQTPIELAIIMNLNDVFMELLRLEPNLSCHGNKKLSPMHYALSHGNAEAAMLLFQKLPESISFLDIDGRTPLHHAAQNCQYDIFRLFVKTDSDLLNIQDSEHSYTPLHQFIVSCRDNSLINYEAAKLLYSDRIRDLKDNNGFNPLELAAFVGNVNLIKFLFVEELKQELPNSLLFIAASQANMELLKYLVEEQKMDISVKDGEGCSVFMNLLYLYTQIKASEPESSIILEKYEVAIKEFYTTYPSSIDVNENYEEIDITNLLTELHIEYADEVVIAGLYNDNLM